MKLLFGGEESDFTQEDERLSTITRESLDDLYKQKKKRDEYELRLIDPEEGVIKVVKKDYGEKAEEGAVLFDDTDLDRGLLGSKQRKILEKLKLPLPSKIMNEKVEVIKLYLKNAEIHLDFFRDLLKNKVIFYTERGVNKARAFYDNPRNDKNTN